MAQFLWTSFLASVVLTILLNLALRLVPGLGDRIGTWLASVSQTRPSRPSRSAPPPPGSASGQPPSAGNPATPAPGDGGQGPRVQVHVPWKAMLIGSILLTLLLNLPRLL